MTASILTSLLLSFTIVVQCMPEVRDWLWYRRGRFLSMFQKRMFLCAHENLHAFVHVRVHFCFVSFPVQGLRLVSWRARDCLVEQERLVGLSRSYLYNLLVHGISVIFWSHCGLRRIPLLRVFWFILVLLVYRSLALLDIQSSFCVWLIRIFV